MNTATVEEFQNHAAALLAAVERGEEFLIARGERAIARLSPVSSDDSEHDEWSRGVIASLARAYGESEPDYTNARIIEPNPDYRP